VTGQAVIDSPDFFQDGSPYFKGIWMQTADFPLGQQAILQALAQQSKDLQQLAAETGLSEDAAKEALSILTIHDVVLRRPDDQCYGFRVEVMRRWVLNTSAKQH
jgi:predicted Rossmann fold nucleotide-binding protein DprA/Smf involved in DNA uptake